MALQAGEQLDAYTIDSPIGRGGMATVYKAYHERLDRHVAIKLMHETFLQDEDFRERFQREARIVAKLEHPAIVQIYDYNEYKNTPYLVMKYVEGMTLKKHFIKQGMTIEEIERILTRVAEGLDYAHSRGILHRDMKPSNILLGQDGKAYITDFGLARIAEAGSSTISHDMMLGTPFYISPEQAQGSTDLDHRTDLYSLGIILYELLTGQVPFQADTPYAIVHSHIYTTPKLASEVNPDLTHAIDTVLSRALEKDRDKRYPNAIALMRDFSRAIKGESPKIMPVGSGVVDDSEQFIPDNATRIEPSHHIDAQPMPTPHQNVVESPVKRSRRKVDAEFDIDMGDINWNSIRDGFQTGVQGLAEMIEERIDTELRQRRGIALTEQEIVRRRVTRKMKQREEFVGHLASYIGVNSMLIAIWFFTGASFFWPIFPMFFWGIGVFTQGIQYYNKYGPGANKVEEEIQRELSNLNSGTAKPKREGERLSVDFATQQADVRLNEDGELSDSFIEEQRNRL